MDSTLHQAGIWLCGEYFSTHTFIKNCKHANGVVVLASIVDDVAIHGIHAPPRADLLVVDNAADEKMQHGFAGFFLSSLEKVLACPDDLSTWVQLFILPCCILTTFVPKKNLNDGQARENSAILLCLIPPLYMIWRPNTLLPPPILPSSLVGDSLFVHKDVVLTRIHSFPKGTSCARDRLRAQHFVDVLGGSASTVTDDLLVSITRVVNLFLSGKCPSGLGKFIASATLTPLVKQGVWRRLVSTVASSSVGITLNNYLLDFQLDVDISMTLNNVLPLVILGCSNQALRISLEKVVTCSGLGFH
ncbi:hypothetical protein V2J09_008865 [Rumex salicifolius]